MQRSFKESYVAGFRVVMLFAAGLALAGAGAAGALVEGKPRFDTNPAWVYNSNKIEPN
jgi:hypothetical protein